MYKLVTSARDANGLSIGFDQHRGRRRDELTSNKNKKDKYHLRIMLKDVFGFVEAQEKATYGLGYILPLPKNKDETVLDKAAGVADARNKSDYIHWFVLHYTLSVQQQGKFYK